MNERTHTQATGQNTDNRKTIICKIVFFVFAAWLALTVLSISFAQIINLQMSQLNEYRTIAPYTLLIFAGIAAIFTLFYFASRRIKIPSFNFTGKKFLIAFAAADILLFAAQIFLFYNIYFETGWDAGYLIEHAQHIAAGLPIEPQSDLAWYYSRYPNNLFLLTSFVGLIRIWSSFGIDAYFGMVITNCIALNAGGILFAFAANNFTKSSKNALYCWIVYTLLITFSGWASIPYSDTFGLFFITLLLLLYSYRPHSSAANYLRLFVFGFVAFMGYKIKPTVIFILIACLFFEILQLTDKKDRFARLTAILFILLGVFCSAFTVGMLISLLPFELVPNQKFTFMHFLMMGANTKNTGRYLDEDVFYSASFATNIERFWKDWLRYLERISEQGFFGYLGLLLKKNILNFSDGMYAWGEEGGFYKNIPPEPLGNFSAALRKFWYSYPLPVYRIHVF